MAAKFSSPARLPGTWISDPTPVSPRRPTSSPVKHYDFVHPTSSIILQTKIVESLLIPPGGEGVEAVQDGFRMKEFIQPTSDSPCRPTSDSRSSLPDSMNM